MKMVSPNIMIPRGPAVLVPTRGLVLPGRDIVMESWDRLCEMLALTHLIGFMGGQENYGALTQITDYTGTTNIGDLTNTGGLAAAFDGTTSQTAQASARNVTAAQIRYIGKGWASAKRIGQFKWWATSNEGGATYGSYMKLYGKNSAPSSATDGTLLFSAQITGGTFGNQVTPGSSWQWTATDGFDISNTYLYHWIANDEAGQPNNEKQCAELQFWAYAN